MVYYKRGKQQDAPRKRSRMKDKEFWEKCGWTDLRELDVDPFVLFGKSPQSEWLHIPNQEHLSYLGFLFKYAVPKLENLHDIMFTLDSVFNIWVVVIWITDGVTVEARDDDPAIALKKAIESVWEER